MITFLLLSTFFFHLIQPCKYNSSETITIVKDYTFLKFHQDEHINDIDIKIVLNTTFWDTEKKTLNNCEDFKFVDKRGNILEYFLDSSCFLEETVVWLRIPRFRYNSKIFFHYEPTDYEDPINCTKNGYTLFDGQFVSLFVISCPSTYGYSTFSKILNHYLVGGDKFKKSNSTYYHDHTNVEDILTSKNVGKMQGVQVPGQSGYGDNHNHEIKKGALDFVDEYMRPLARNFRACVSEFGKTQAIIPHDMVQMMKVNGSIENGINHEDIYDDHYVYMQYYSQNLEYGYSKHNHLVYGSYADFEYGVGDKFSAELGEHNGYTRSLHRHSFYKDSTDSENKPPYMSVVMGRNLGVTTEFKAKEDFVFIATGVPIGYKVIEEFIDRFPIGGKVYGEQGGAESHTHVINSEKSGNGSYGSTINLGGFVFGHDDHHHTVYGISTAKAALPPRYHLLFLEHKKSPEIVFGEVVDHRLIIHLTLIGLGILGLLIALVIFILCFLYLGYKLKKGGSLIKGNLKRKVSIVMEKRKDKKEKEKKRLTNLLKIEEAESLISKISKDDPAVEETLSQINLERKMFNIDFNQIKTIQALSSSGGVSKVYLAKWNTKKVAFKCFKLPQLEEGDIELFEREVSLLSELNHPCIGIVLEYCEKGGINEHLSSEKDKGKIYSLKKRILICKTICEGMEYLHEKKILHRDLKPENVLLTKKLEAKIIDFGLSRISERFSVQKTKGVGTSYYIAPEVVKSFKYDEKCDVFSFSIMLFEIISYNFNPFDITEDNAHNVELRIANQRKFRPNTKVLKKNLKEDELWLIDIMVKGWSHHSERRYAFSEIVKIINKHIK